MPTSKEAKDYVKQLGSRLVELGREVNEIDAQIVALHQRRSEYKKEIDSVVYAFENTGKPLEDAFRTLFPDTPSIALKSTMRLGDAMETIIKIEGPRRQKEIIQKIRTAGIRLSDKAPYVVIANAIRSDKKKRFKLLKDGRVALKESRQRLAASSI